MPDAATIDPAPARRRRSEAQRRASQTNGARSRGPVTAEGKAASSRNALVHGMFALENVVLPGEDAIAFEERRRRIVVALETVGDHEVGLAHTVAAAQLREQRIEAMLTATLAGPPPEDDDAPLAGIEARVVMLDRMLARAQTAQVRALAELRRLQNHRTHDQEARQNAFHRGCEETGWHAQWQRKALEAKLAQAEARAEAAEARLAADAPAAAEMRNEPARAESKAETTAWTDLDDDPPVPLAAKLLAGSENCYRLIPANDAAERQNPITRPRAPAVAGQR